MFDPELAFEKYDRRSDDFINDLTEREAEAHIRWYSNPEEREQLKNIFRPHILSYLNKSREKSSNHFTNTLESGAVQPGELRKQVLPIH